ncbi:MAG TPA: hypothetical protein PLW86_04835, partial [Rhodocyclaceae bacterium]|nr:hypothetical protein [Rhodocyclaceae bacterium]
MSAKKERPSPKAQPASEKPDFLKTMQEYTRLQGMMLYQLMALKSAVVPFTKEVMDLHRIGLSVDPEQRLTDWVERQQSAVNFQKFVDTIGCELFGSATYDGEEFLAETEFFTLTYIPVKAGVKRRASLFHIGGFVPYSDNLFRLLPSANLFDRFIENGIAVYEMKLKCDKTQYNAHMLEMTIADIIETVHAFSDIAFAHNGREAMILEGYCGTGVHTYTSYLADIKGMAKKFRMILTFVSPLDARKCTIFEQVHEVLAYINPQEGPVEGATISGLLDTIQDRNFEKTPMGALVHGWKNKEYAHINSISDLTQRQQSELVSWYWLSLRHGSFYPLSKDLYTFYSKLFTKGVSASGELPYVYKGQVLNIVDLKTTGVPVLVFLGEKDHLVDCHTADILEPLLGDQAKVVVHQKTGHVAYIFNPNRWQKDDARAFTPDVIATIFNTLGVTEMAKEKAKETKVAAKPAAKAAAKPAVKAAAKPAAKPAAKAAAKPAAKAAAKPA